VVAQIEALGSRQRIAALSAGHEFALAPAAAR
jgi:hypothetical protein